MNLTEQFIPWLHEQVYKYRDEYATLRNDGDAFSAWAMGYIHELEPDEAINASDTYVAQGDKGLDGFYIPTSENIVYLAQSKYSETPASAVYTATQLESLSNAWHRLVADRDHPDPGLTDRGKEIANLLSEAEASEADIIFQYFIAGRLSSEQFDQLRLAIEGLEAPVTADVWDLSRLHELWISRETSSDLSGQTVSIRLATASDITIDAPAELPSIGSSALVNLDARSLGEVASANDPSIYSANVRYHLGPNKINSSIRRALRDPYGRASFWYLNNGLTIVADAFDVGEDEVQLVNPQIVNGCQTTKALSLERLSIPEGSTKVLARVIQVEGQSKEDELVRISEATNSQNPVRPEDLKSNDRTQRELQASFRNVGWFYERKRKEWNSLTAAQKGAYGTRRVTNIDVAQCWRAFSFKPTASVQSKSEHFQNTVVYSELFDSGRSPYEYLAAVKLAEFWNSLLAKNASAARHNLHPAFMADIDGVHDDPILSKILRAKRLWVMHATAVSHGILNFAYAHEVSNEADQLLTILLDDPQHLDAMARVVVGGYLNWEVTLEHRHMDIRVAFKRAEENSFDEWQIEAQSFANLNFPDEGLRLKLPPLL